MTYRTRTIIKVSVGLVLVGALALFAYFGLYRQQRTERQAEMKNRLALNLEKEKVTKIELINDRSTTVLEKRSMDENKLPVWHMVKPVDAKADSITINSLLGVMERMDAERRIDLSSAGSLEKFGLAKPRLKWVLSLDDGKKIEFLLGKRSPFDKQLYSMVAGSKSVILLKGYLEDSLVKSTFDLRDKNLLSFDPSGVESLRIQRPAHESKGAKGIELFRENGIWKISAPVKDRADEKEVKRILKALENLRAKAFPNGSAGEKAYGLAPASYRITIKLAHGDERYVIEMGHGTLKSNKDMAFARVRNPPGPLAKVSTYQLNVVNKRVDDLRFRNLLDLDTSKVARIKIDGEDGLMVIERSLANGKDAYTEEKNPEYTWALVSPVAKKAKTYKVQALLSALADLRASSLGPAPTDESLLSTGLASPRKTVTVFDEQGKTLGMLRIGSESKASTWVLGDARQNICLVPSGSLSSVLVEPKDLEQD